MPLSAAQRQICDSRARYRVAVCGRRFGKTHVCPRELARFGRYANRRVWYVAPSYRMAKQIAWQPVKESLISCNWVQRANEQDLSVTLVNGSQIALRGADKPDSLRGVGLDFLIIDEAADVKEEAWTQVLRPTLADTGGHALFLGTPKGYNWFHGLWERGQSANEPHWASWQFTTLEGGNVPAEEVEEARRTMDALSFQAEFEASFVTMEGRAYYEFARNSHCATLTYNRRAPLAFCFDFNVEPGVAVVCQEQTLPNGLEGTGVIGEVHIPRNSNTPAVCRRLAADWRDHEGPIRIYGDASGGARGSARVMGADWDLVKQTLREQMPKHQFAFRIPRANPPVRSRLSAMNSRCKSAAGDIRLMIDPDKAPHVLRDLEGVVLLKGGSGEIDKKKDEKLTHSSDALGYYVVEDFAPDRGTFSKQRLRS